MVVLHPRRLNWLPALRLSSAADLSLLFLDENSACTQVPRARTLLARPALSLPFLTVPLLIQGSLLTHRMEVEPTALEERAHLRLFFRKDLRDSIIDLLS